MTDKYVADLHGQPRRAARRAVPRLPGRPLPGGLRRGAGRGRGHARAGGQATTTRSSWPSGTPRSATTAACAAPGIPAVRDKEMDHDGVGGRGDLPGRRLGRASGASPRRRSAPGLGLPVTATPSWSRPGRGPTTAGWPSSASTARSAGPGWRSCPLHDIGAAVTMIEWAAGHGLRGGIMIPTRWGKLPSVQRPVLRPGVGRRRRDRAAGAHALRGRARTTTASPPA